MKLNTKLWLLMIASSIIGPVIFIILSLVIGSVFSKGYVSKQLIELGHQVVEEAVQVQSHPDQIIDLLDRTVALHPQLDLEWVACDGSLIYATNGRTQNYEFNEMLSQFLYMPFNSWEPGKEITLLFTWNEEQRPQYLIMKIPDEAMQGSQVQIFLRDYSHLLHLVLPFLLFLATPYVLAFVFIARINRRLKKLTNAMNDLNAEKSVIMIHDPTKDEIGQLARHFNTMSQRISAQVAQIHDFERNRKTLIANLSHDLRTPMTKIQGYAETLYEEFDDTEKERKKFANIILRHSRYMDKLLHKLLEISNLDSRKERILLKESNVSEDVRKIAADFVPVLESKGMKFDIQIPEQPIYALTDSYLFERAIRNLIENAIIYGSSGHYLGIALEHRENEVQIRIIDRGPGIPKQQISLIFERFYRGSNARKGEGIGIGLSIVREIAEAHNGKVEVHSVPNENTVFTLTVPGLFCDHAVFRNG